MLEAIKEVLIREKKQELKQKEEINQQINLIKQEEKETIESLDKELKDIENEIKTLNESFFSRIFKSKRIKSLYNSYVELSHNKAKTLKKINTERDELLKKLYEVAHNEFLVEKEIQKIESATTLKELGLTEKQALVKIKDCSKKDDKIIIKNVFLNIKNNGELESREDIFRNMQKLYQTNVSPFVTAMRKVLPSDLVSELVDVGIVIDEDKIEFIKNLTSYTLSPTHDKFPITSKQNEVGRLDRYYYSEIEKAIANMERYSKCPLDAVSKIMTLTVLVSIAKANKAEKVNKK